MNDFMQRKYVCAKIKLKLYLEFLVNFDVKSAKKVDQKEMLCKIKTTESVFKAPTRRV